jgi:CRP/FNR family transcriptional regulator
VITLIVDPEQIDSLHAWQPHGDLLMHVATDHGYNAGALTIVRSAAHAAVHGMARPMRAGTDVAPGRCEACHVRALSLCDSLPARELAELEAISVDVSYANGATLFDQGEIEASVYIITDGVARIMNDLPDGRRSILGFAMPGDFLGLSFDDRHACSVKALGRVSACKISRKAFTDLVDRKPALLRRLHAETTHELTLAHEQMLILGRYTARERTAAFLLGMRKRWKRVTGKSSHIPLPMTRQDIGDFIGTTVETVSRMLTAMAREKLIVIVPEGVRVLDIDRLSALVES